MRQFLTICAFLLICVSSKAVVGVDQNWSAQFQAEPEIQSLTPEMVQLNLDKFLTMTPKEYKKMTGKKLGLKKTLQMKAAQKMLKKKLNKEPDIAKGLFVVLAILGVAWVAMGVMDDWSGSDWIVNLVLYLLCYLPGLIHALTKMKKYY